MLLLLLITNLLHAAVALVFCAGLRPFTGPLSASRWSHLLGLGLALPVFITAGRLLGIPAPPEELLLLRAEAWLELIQAGGWPLWIGGGVLLLGTTLIFLFQEALPLLLSRQGERGPVPGTPRLEPLPEVDASFARLIASFQTRGHLRWAKPPTLQIVEDERMIASVRGLTRSKVVISSSLIERLDPGELEGVLAHEIAHVARGGNLVRFSLWILRALQAPNPFALTLARAHFEANESACDALAANVTGKPAALASALLRTRNRSRVSPLLPAFRRARLEMHRRSDLEATRARVHSLLHESRHVTIGIGDGLLFRLPRLLLVAALLWAIA